MGSGWNEYAVYNKSASATTVDSTLVVPQLGAAVTAHGIYNRRDWLVPGAGAKLAH